VCNCVTFACADIHSDKCNVRVRQIHQNLVFANTPAGQELDLKVGMTFTRFQTRFFQGRCALGTSYKLRVSTFLLGRRLGAYYTLCVVL
jgi:hypothetical protein